MSVLKNGLTKQTRGIDSDDLSISNASTNNSGRVTQFAISSTNSFGKLNIIENGGMNDMINEMDTENNESSNEIDTKLNDNSNLLDENDDDSENRNPLVNVENGPDSDIISISNPRSTSPPAPERSEAKSPPPIPTATSEHQAKLMEAANDAAMIKLQLYSQFKTLPWKPKVRLVELESFLNQERKKFFGYGDLPNDLETMIGLPYPIQESVKILKQHLYKPLSDEQIKLEEKIAKYPLSTKDLTDTNSDEDGLEENPSEILFSSLLPNLPQYLVIS